MNFDLINIPRISPMGKTTYNLTKEFLKKLEIPEQGKRFYYRDSRVRGLQVMITDRGIISFQVYRYTQNRIVRVTLGRYPELSIENARKKAEDANAQIADGTNPNIEKKKLRQEITLSEMFQNYLERYSKPYKKSWKYDEREVKKFLSHWFNRKLSTVTKQEIQILHEKISKENGIYAANRLLERIRAIYNKAIQWGWHGINPAAGIKKFREKSRDRFLQPDELPKFFKALEQEENKLVADYIMISLLTGARKSNVLAMRWDEINFERKTWTIPETKNGEPLTIPLADAAIEILKQIKARALSKGGAEMLRVYPSELSVWVFSSSNSKSGHIEEPKRAWRRVLEKAEITDLRIHDLRRTLGSWLASTGASPYIIGKSLGHKSQQATAVYARLNLDPVRESVEKATRLIRNFGQ